MKIKTTPIVLFLVLASLQNSFSQTFSITTIKDSVYHISYKGNAKAGNISWSTLPDSWKNSKQLTVKTGNDTLKLETTHPLVLIKTEANKSEYFSIRAIPLQGAANFRDLGGYKTKDGKEVKWGKLYRSADISKLTENDLKILSAIHVKVDCDLRGPKEADIAPDKISSSIERIFLPAGSENVGGGMQDYAPFLKSEHTADSMMMAMYSKTDHLQKKYKPMFDRLLTLGTDEALLFHCTAGKDRTGIGAALILYALGVDETVIYEDYELTNFYRKASNEQFIKMLTSKGVSENAAKVLMSADKKYLKATFDAIKKQYGSMELFLQNEMGLNKENQNILLKKYLY
jgi:protein-tyrosine phosphatase